MWLVREANRPGPVNDRSPANRSVRLPAESARRRSLIGSGRVSGTPAAALACGSCSEKSPSGEPIRSVMMKNDKSWKITSIIGVMSIATLPLDRCDLIRMAS